MGGRPLSPQTTDPDERKILNVVEEMAIASGTPVPPVYLLEQEDGINAFAAGYTPGDAVIGVTRGCIRQPDPRRAPGGHRPRVQPHPQRRHAAEHPPDRRALRHPADQHDRLDHLPVARPTRTGTRAGATATTAGRQSLAAGRPGAVRPGLCRGVLRQPDQGGREPPARVPGRRLGRAVHPQSGRDRRGPQEDRRAGRGLAASQAPEAQEASHLFFGDAVGHLLERLRHPSPAGRADPPDRPVVRRRLLPGPGRGTGAGPGPRPPAPATLRPQVRPGRGVFRFNPAEMVAASARSSPGSSPTPRAC